MAEEEQGTQTPQGQSIDQGWSDYWVKELAAAKKWLREYHDVAHRVEDRYLGKPSEVRASSDEVSSTFNIFWSNIQVILSAIFARVPKPEINRAHLDPNDDVARVASTMLQRIFESQFMTPDTSPLFALHDAAEDRFVAGLGQIWVRYEFDSETVSPIADMPQLEIEVVTDERAPLDYIRWEDFLFSPARRWSEVRWTARRHYFRRSEAIEKFGELIGNQLPLTSKSSRRSTNDSSDPIKATSGEQVVVWEIWYKPKRVVFWKAEGFERILRVDPDPLKLTQFWPCPMPLLATHGTRSMIPTPDYMMARAQYAELEMLTSRCVLLSEAIRVVGAYDKTSTELKRILSQTAVNDMIPVDNWAMFAEKGGIKGSVDWFPMEMVVDTLEKLTIRKSAVLNELYEILGISDLMRGMTVASETATAQKLKAQFGGARVSNVKNQLGNFVTSSLWLMLEVVSRHWQPEAIVRASAIEHTVDRQYAEAAVELIKSSPDLIYRISVSIDSMGSPDWNEEKTQRTEFLQAMAQFIGMSMPLMQQAPATAIYIVQILQWAATGFKSGSQIESVLDQCLAAIQQSLATPKPPPPPSPEQLKDLSAADKNAAGASKARVEGAAKAIEYGLPPQMAMLDPPPSRQARPGGQPSSPRGQGPQPPGAPTQAGPIPPA